MSAPRSDFESYAGIRATVLGLGSFGGGSAAARFLAENGAIVTITDARSYSELEPALAGLTDVEFAGVFAGGHPPEAFHDCDLVVVNPAVRPDADVLEVARSSGATLTSEIELFLKHCRAPVIAVTGTNGKSTTAALTYHLLNSSPSLKAWLGGNIGQSLLPEVRKISEADIVVLELSSFQLERLRDSRFHPHIAVITNFSPNHLDWHGDISQYRNAKQVLLNHQTPNETCIVSDEAVVNLPATAGGPEEVWRIRSQCMRFGISDSGEDGVFAEDGTMVFRKGNFEDAIRLTQPRQLAGQHNLRNIAAAACAAWVSGLSPDDIPGKLAEYTPLPHRLQLVTSRAGIQFINDSVSTTPESSIAALETVAGPTVIIAGGADKGADLSHLVKAIAAQAKAAVFIGQTSPELARQLQQTMKPNESIPWTIAQDFKDAFRKAVDLVPPGGKVLLSPGCASFGWFRDYRERGDLFTQMALNWTTAK